MPVGFVEFPDRFRLRRRVIKEKICIFIPAKLARNDLRPGRSPIGVGLQECHAARAISRIKLASSAAWVIKEQIGTAAAPEIPGNDLRPGRSPIGVLTKRPKAASPIREVAVP